MGSAEQLQIRTSKLWQTVGKPGERSRRTCFYGEMEEVRRGCLGEFTGEGFSLAECASFSLAGLFLEEEQLVLPLAYEYKLNFLLFGDSVRAEW